MKDNTAKERMRRYRNKKRNETVTQSPESVTAYPAILKVLVDPVKRRKLEKIYQSLKDFKQEKNVFYGYPQMIPFDVVGDLLEATR